VTVKVFTAVFPFASVAVHVTVVIAIGSAAGDAGAQTTGAEAPPTAVAVGGVYITVAPAELVASAVKLVGVPVIVGAVACTKTVKLVCAVLLWVSVAVHVTVVVPTANLEFDMELDAGEHVTRTDAPPAAVAVGFVYVTNAPVGPPCTVMLGGVPAITGGVAWTVTVKLECALLPCASVAVQFTVVVPTGNVEPDVGVQPTRSVPSTRSVAVGFVYVTATPVGPPCAVMLGGVPLMTGAVVSWTVTLKFDCELLPNESVAVQITFVVVIAKTDPEPGWQFGTREPPVAALALGSW
jgi:hypothetical protein